MATKPQLNADSNMEQEPGDDAGGDQQQTVEIPLSACPDCKEGDTIPMKVVSIDQQAGVINAMPQETTPDENGGGSDQMAEQLGNAGDSEQSQ